MQIGYLYIRPVEALCVRSTGPYKLSAAQAWGTMLAWLEERGLRAGLTRGYGVIHDNPASTEPHLRRYDACVEVPPTCPRSLPASWRAVLSPAGRTSCIGTSAVIAPSAPVFPTCRGSGFRAMASGSTRDARISRFT